MIKIGCAAYSYRIYLQDGRMRYEDFIKEMYRIGLDGVELTLYWLPSKDKSYFRELKRVALFYGMPISGAGISTNFCNPSVEERNKEVEKVREGLGIAHELGAPCLRVFGGPVPKGYSEDEAMKWVIEALQSCVKYAEENGVVIALENHGGITSTADNVVKIIECVDSPWVRVNLDLGNYRGESLYEEAAKTVPYAVHTHAKVNARRGEERVEIDYNRIKDILKSKGYNGFLSIEYEETEDPKTGVPKFAKKLFSIFSL